MAIIIGLFILAAIIKNRDLSGENAPEQNKDIRDYLSIFVVILVLGGLGFLFGTRFENHASTSLLVPFFLLMMPLAIFTRGPTKAISQVAAISILAFVCVGAYL